MVLAEAISHGIYCISSNCKTGPSDIIVNRVNGELYQVNNKDELRDIIQKIILGVQLPENQEIIDSINSLYSDLYLQRLEQALKI